MHVVSTSTLYKNLLNVKNIIIEDVKLWSDKDAVRHLTIIYYATQKRSESLPDLRGKMPWL